MKINLAENLLRFGAKNLSEESKKKLTEQAYPVYGKGEVPLKPGVYRTNYAHGAKSVDTDPTGQSPTSYLIIPKGTTFTVDPKNPNVAYATVLKGVKWASGSIPAGYKGYDMYNDAKAGALIVQLQKDAQPVQVTWSADFPETLAVKGSTVYFRISPAMTDALKKQFSTM